VDCDWPVIEGGRGRADPTHSAPRGAMARDPLWLDWLIFLCAGVGFLYSFFQRASTAS
jgi:hypothetical protein